MKKYTAGPRRRAVLVLALLLGGALAGCKPPLDTAWLRFLGFQETASSSGTSDTTTTSAGYLAVVEGELNDNTTIFVDATFENDSARVGSTGNGTGIHLYLARVTYSNSLMPSRTLEFPLNLYLPPAATSGTTTTASAGTLRSFPIVPAAFKQWYIDNYAFDDPVDSPFVEITARVRFFASTDEGAELEVVGGIRITLENTP